MRKCLRCGDIGPDEDFSSGEQWCRLCIRLDYFLKHFKLHERQVWIKLRQQRSRCCICDAEISIFDAVWSPVYGSFLCLPCKAANKIPPKKALADISRFTKKNTDKLKRRLQAIRNNYGLCESEVWEILQRQSSLCAVCGAEINLFNCHVDHCHGCDRVRGFLCQKCNLGIGWLQDDPGIIEKARVYVENHEAIYQHTSLLASLKRSA